MAIKLSVLLVAALSRLILSEQVAMDMYVELMKKNELWDSKYQMMTLDNQERFIMEKLMINRDKGILMLNYYPPQAIYLLKPISRSFRFNWIYASPALPYNYFTIVIDRKSILRTENIKRMLRYFASGYTFGLNKILNYMSKINWNSTVLKDFNYISQFPKFFEENTPKNPENYATIKVLIQPRFVIEDDNKIMNKIIPQKNEGHTVLHKALIKLFKNMAQDMLQILANDGTLILNSFDRPDPKQPGKISRQNSGKLGVRSFLEKFTAFVYSEIDALMALLGDESQWNHHFLVSSRAAESFRLGILPIYKEQMASFMNLSIQLINQKDHLDQRADLISKLNLIEKSFVDKQKKQEKFFRFYRFMYTKFVMPRLRNWDSRMPKTKSFSDGINSFMDNFGGFLDEHLNQMEIPEERGEVLDAYLTNELDFLATVMTSARPGLIQFFMASFNNLYKSITKTKENLLFYSTKVVKPESSYVDSILSNASLFGASTPINDPNSAHRYRFLRLKKSLVELYNMKTNQIDVVDANQKHILI